jgi:acyl-coenzyme A thioesterase PaaI-like protein
MDNPSSTPSRSSSPSLIRPRSFELAVAVEPLGRGRYRSVVDPTWDGPGAPNGGVLAAILVRAAQTELGSKAPPPRAIAVQYLEAPSHGCVEVGVEVLRAGRRVIVCDVRMRVADRLICQTTIVCSAAREQSTHLNANAPQAPAYNTVQKLEFPVIPGVVPPIMHQLEIRPTFGSPIFSGASNALTGGWVAFRGDNAPLDAARLCALCDLWWPAIFNSLTAPVPLATVQLTVYLRSTSEATFAPVLARYETRNVTEGHLEESGRLWSADGRLLAESHQLAVLGPDRPSN